MHVVTGARRRGRHVLCPARAPSWCHEDLDTVLEPGHEGNGWLAQTGQRPARATWVTPRRRPAPSRWSRACATPSPGDRARHLADGQIELLGRDSVTVNSGGEKIFVEEVERAIAGHPAVADVVVAGRPSERWGQEVVGRGPAGRRATRTPRPSPSSTTPRCTSPATSCPRRWSSCRSSSAPPRARPTTAGRPSRPRARRRGLTTVTLRTERLVLRPFAAADLAPFAALNAHPAGGRVAGLVRRPGPRAMPWSSAISAEMATEGWGLWAVEVVGGAPFIGMVGPAPGQPVAPLRPGGRDRVATAPGPLGPRLRHRGGRGRSSTASPPAA